MEITYHTKISFIKSLLRIIGYLVLLTKPIIGIILLIFAEILGILEEA